MLFCFCFRTQRWVLQVLVQRQIVTVTRKPSAAPSLALLTQWKLFTGNWVTREQSLNNLQSTCDLMFTARIYHDHRAGCTTWNPRADRKWAQLPGPGWNELGSEAGVWDEPPPRPGVSPVAHFSAHFSRQYELLWGGSGGGERASARRQSGLPRRRLAVWKEPLSLSPHPGPGPRSAGFRETCVVFLLGIVDPGFRARVSSVFCLASKLPLNLCSWSFSE